MTGSYHGEFHNMKENLFAICMNWYCDDSLLYCFSEMIEAVGHEFMEDFFGSCETVLAENGLFVIQVGSFDCYRHIQVKC